MFRFGTVAPSLLFLLSIFTQTLLSSTLTDRIDALKNNLRTTDDRALLVVYEIFASQFSNAAERSKGLFFITRDWNHLLNEGLARMATKDRYAQNVWRDFLLLENQEKPGPRWRALAETCRAVVLGDAIPDEDAWIEEIRLCYSGKGYYTAKILIDIYETYGGKKDLSFLKEIRAECLYKSACYQEAIAIYQKKFSETGDEYYLYTQAKCYSKMAGWIESRGLLMSINNEKLKTFNYYYLLTLASHGLGLDSEMKGYLAMAKSKSSTTKESSMLQEIAKSL